MLNWLYTLVDWVTAGRDPREWRPARLEVAASGFTIERPKAAPIAIAWASISALTLTAVKRRGVWVACLTVTHGPKGEGQPILASWGNFPAFATALASRLGYRRPERWDAEVRRDALPDVDIEIPLPRGGLAAADPAAGARCLT